MSQFMFAGSDLYTALLARAAAHAESVHDAADEGEVEADFTDLCITVTPSDRDDWKVCEAIELLTSNGQLGNLCVEKHIGGKSYTVWADGPTEAAEEA